MALETAASIISILAAAGKIAETLGSFVSVWRDSDKHTSTVLSEVHSTRTVLSALQRYLSNLSMTPRRCTELIQADQLVATLYDGELIFSELEALVLSLSSPGHATSNRIRWAMNDDKFAALVSRLQCFKSSITIIMNILQCESDMEAQDSQQELLILTRGLLTDNAELSNRIAHLEGCFNASLSTPKIPTKSVAIIKRTTEGAPAAIEQKTSGAPFNSANLPFERVLFSSKVYHRLKDGRSDISFRSSSGLSHAWIALSEISLSDISALSVVGLPLHSPGIANPTNHIFGSYDRGRYHFTPFTKPAQLADEGKSATESDAFGSDTMSVIETENFTSESIEVSTLYEQARVVQARRDPEAPLVPPKDNGINK